MGKEGQELEDPRLAAAQASSLFYCKLPAELPRDTPAVVVQRYSCPTKSGGFRKGTLIQIRPTTTNVQEFLAYLQRNQPVLYAELMDSDRGEKKAEDHFPETPTFRSEYSKALIRAYYLLGRYLASTAVRTELLREGRL